MNLFSTAGVELAKKGRVARPVRVPLISHKVIKDVLTRIHFDSTSEQRSIATKYAEIARSKKFKSMNEVQVRGRFYEDVLCKILGYSKVDPNNSYTLDVERAIRGGSVDIALGRFPDSDGKDQIIAPLEMKGPKTEDLEAVMPGRGRSPVQQAWDYDIDAPGSRWVLVSNCIELRLYSFGRGRDAYELFDLRKLDEEAELERLWLILSAGRFISGATEELLRQSEAAYKDITGKLYAEYAGLRLRLVSFLSEVKEGPGLPPLHALELAQKLLDRILFVAFAQRTELLPDKLLERAAKEKNAFRPEPLWKNFNSLFHAIDVGNDELSIDAYNGGLFAPDAVADDLIIPDPLATDLADLAKWDYRSEVPVTVLGHIFEQSITDLEKLRAKKVGQTEPKVSKRKREGVVYTPDVVTRFLVERTVGLTLSEKFDALLAKHSQASKLKDESSINWRLGDASEVAFWRDYVDALRNLTVLDPACGSGAFLVAAFDVLAREYRRAVDRLIDLDAPVDFDVFDEIITKNLYGVDLNAESVEITRLALWLKTARRQHRLQNLEATIKVGNSLIADAAFTDRAFVWSDAFSAQGGKFDIVIGNPPYVRSETIAAIKPYLRKNYHCFDGGADLYCYFFEKGLSLLKSGGRLGFISSSGFFKTAFGANLRKHFEKSARFECGVDFGDARIFEDVTTYPAIVTVINTPADQPYSFPFLNYEGDGTDDLAIRFNASAFSYPSERLKRNRWHFEPEPLWRLRDTIEHNAVGTLKDIAAPVVGIKTGLTEAFVLSNEDRNQITQRDHESSKLIRAWTVGDDLNKWLPDPSEQHLLFIPKGWTRSELKETDETAAWKKFQARYPGAAKWLAPFENDARKRSDKGDQWWELRACDYYDLFDEELVTYPEMSQGPKFALKEKGTVSNNKTFLIPDSDPALLAILNSRVSWFLLHGICTALRGGKWRLELRSDFLKELPLPIRSKAQSAKLERLAKRCKELIEESDRIKLSVRKRLFDLSPGPASQRLSHKLENWWELSFSEFLVEIRKTFKVEISLSSRGKWQSHLEKNADLLKSLVSQLATVERQIDSQVYDLFGLHPTEVALLEESLAGQY